VNQPVSVVMAVFNGRRYLTQQVESIVSQLQSEDELIIVDDASTDGAVSSLPTHLLGNARLFTNVVNIGVRRTFQRGLELARHDIVFLSDQDDVWLQGKRAAFVEEFARDAAVFVVISDARVMDAQGQVTAVSFMANRGGFDGSVIGTLWRNRYLGCAMAVRKELLNIALPIPRWVPQHDMWFGVIGQLTGRVAYLPAPYLLYRRHGANVSPSRSRSPWRLLRWRVALLSALVLRMISVSLKSQPRAPARMPKS
jgi:glycosyltransferase involved in cell wall biosynthesis